MLMRMDPFQELDRLNRWFAPGDAPFMAIDGYRHGDVVTLLIDMPGVDPNTVDLTVERNELKIEAQRRREDPTDAQFFIRERPSGAYVRRLFINDSLDTDHIDAEYVNGVLVVRIPVKDSAKPRRIDVKASEPQKVLTSKS